MPDAPHSHRLAECEVRDARRWGTPTMRFVTGQRSNWNQGPPRHLVGAGHPAVAHGTYYRISSRIRIRALESAVPKQKGRCVVDLTTRWCCPRTILRAESSSMRCVRRVV